MTTVADASTWSIVLTTRGEAARLACSLAAIRRAAEGRDAWVTVLLLGAERAAAVLAAAETRHGTQARLERAAAVLEALAAEVPHVALTDVEVQPGRVVRHLELCVSGDMQNPAGDGIENPTTPA